MRLYYARNTISIAVAIALEEAGLVHDLTEIRFEEAEQTGEAYHAVNPKGRVPALEIGGSVITETGAILEHIAATSPEAGLVPSDPRRAARMREVMYFLASTMHVNHAHKMRGARWADRPESWADMRAKVPETMRSSARYIEESCLRGPFVLGDTFSLADPYLFVVARWLPGDTVPLHEFPGIEAFVTAMEARASVRKIREKGLLTL